MGDVIEVRKKVLMLLQTKNFRIAEKSDLTNKFNEVNQ